MIDRIKALCWAASFTVLAASGLAGCSESTEPTAGKNTVDIAGDAKPKQAAAADKPARNRGTVLSNQPSGGYSYLEVDVDGTRFWLATGVSAVKPGDRIAWRDYAVMSNFVSKSLNREFDSILFVDRVFPESSLASKSHRGKVVETMNAAGYSYIQVEENGTRVWLAVPVTAIEVGQTISWSSGTPMRNFTSQSLNRSFDEIYFVTAVQAS